MIGVTNNSLGLRGPEPDGRGKGIMFLGDSFVWGYDVEADERFTEKLQAMHAEWPVHNLGVSGYGSDQEYLLLQRYFDKLNPRLVVVVFCSDNDFEDNCWNFRYGGYKPYCVETKAGLRLQGVPVPRSERAWLGAHERLARLRLVSLLVRTVCRLTAPQPARHEDPTFAILDEMRRYTVKRGAHFLVGVQEKKPRLTRFLESNYFEWLDIETTNRYQAVEFGRHWTPQGHTDVASRIEKFLAQKKYLDETPSTAVK